MANFIVEFPKYTSPEGKNYQTYQSYLRLYNELLQKRVHQLLHERFREDGSGYVIMTTGSDGRSEKGPESLMELVAISTAGHFDVGLLQRIRAVGRKYADRRVFEDPELYEIKNLHHVGSLSYFKANRERAFPSRLIDSVYLYGDEDIHRAALLALGREFFGSEGKRIREKTKDRKREYRSLMLTGKQRVKEDVKVHFNFDTGVSHYNPLEYYTGFKHGPLRFIQFGFIEALIHYIRETGNVEILHDLPHSTRDRLMYIEGNNLTPLSSEELGILDDQYHFFLWMLHRQQHQYKESFETDLPFEPEEVRFRVKTIDMILRPERRLIERRKIIVT